MVGWGYMHMSACACKGQRSSVPSEDGAISGCWWPNSGPLHQHSAIFMAISPGPWY